MKIYLTAKSALLPPSGIKGCNIAHLDYSVGPGRRLLRSNKARAYKGGLLVISGESLEAGDGRVFAAELVRECTVRGYSGVMFSFDSGCDCSLLSSICQRLKGSGLSLYVPEKCGETVEGAKVMLTTAISGGSLALRLEEAGEKYGVGRLALDIERLAMDFTLPSPTGEGKALSRDELKELLEKRSAQTFFSGDLCAHYFTYSEGGKHHFVLYDTAGSIKKKLAVARQYGISEGFLMYSEVEDILGQLII